MFQYPQNASTNAGQTAKTIYTCPAGRTAIVKTINATNNHGAAVVGSASFLDGGVTSTSLATNISLSAGSSANLLSDVLCLTAGEILQVNSHLASGVGVFRWATQTTLSDTTAHALGAGAVVTGIVYANSLYVAYGSRTGAGLIATSSDALTWTIRAFGGNGAVTDVAFGNGNWVATVGINSVVYTSPDAITWTSRTHPHAQTMNCVAYGDGVWVIAGDAGLGATATDPTGTWTNNASITTASSSNAINCITYASWLDLWVMGVSTTAVITASDATSTWTVRATALGVRAIAHDGSTRLIAFTNNTNTGWTSTNGTTWTAMPAAQAPTNTTAAAYTKRSLIYANSMFVIMGNSGSNPAVAFCTSTDGLTWIPYTVSTTVIVAGVTSFDCPYFAGAYGSAGWVNWQSSGTGKIGTPIAALSSNYCGGMSFTASIVETQ